MFVAAKTYTKFNFHSYTFCVWKEVPSKEIENLKVNYKSESGSEYIFTTEGLYRVSNHWGRVADCHWRLVPLAEYKNQNVTVAFAKWSDFYPNDNSAKIFYIKVDFETNEVNFYHIQSDEKPEGLILRNANETAKIIRVIKEVLTEINWAKYLTYSDLDELRREIVKELINTEKSFLEIKKRYL